MLPVLAPLRPGLNICRMFGRVTNSLQLPWDRLGYRAGQEQGITWPPILKTTPLYSVKMSRTELALAPTPAVILSPRAATTWTPVMAQQSVKEMMEVKMSYVKSYLT